MALKDRVFPVTTTVTLDNFVDLCDILRCSIDSLVVRNESIPPLEIDSSGDSKDSYTLIRFISRVGKQQ